VPPLVSGQLQPQREVLDGDGLMPRAQQSNEPKYTHNDRQHENGLFSLKVNVLGTDIFLARDNMIAQEFGMRGAAGEMPFSPL
jgi:hypothetical protein